jgi:hypothetical protein
VALGTLGTPEGPANRVRSSSGSRGGKLIAGGPEVADGGVNGGVACRERQESA